ncbi:MAG: flagellar filament capping protein FliD [Pyrinomonadaceae bacterium]
MLAGAATTATFELRKGGATTGPAITINSANNSLDGLSQAINSANVGITASVVDITGAGSFQLVLQSTATGTASRVELVETTATDTNTVAGLNLTRINAPGGTLPGDFGYLDSQVSLNGLTITRSTNQISDAITGVTYNLQKIGATSVNVISASDLPVKLQGFADAYNAVQDFMLSQ